MKDILHTPNTSGILHCHTRIRLRVLCCFILCLLTTITAQGQAADSLTSIQKRNRQLALGIGFATTYTTGMVLLHNAWYKHDTRSSFHFYNDNSHWKQMDKAGHFWGAFQQSRGGVDMLKWAGVPDKEAIIYGSMVGILLQTPIEIFDGFGEEYGASVGDAVANTLGSAAVGAQHLAWGELRITPKFSFHTTPYATERLEMVGDNYFGQMLKDYNGQTYWLSVDVSAFLPDESKYPKWLNLAAGYGAADMVTGDPYLNKMRDYNAYRQYYLSVDLNLMNIKTDHSFLKKMFYVLSIFKFPAPALEFNSRKGLVFHPIYY